MSPQQELNTWPPKHWVGALSTQIQEIIKSNVISVSSYNVEVTIKLNSMIIMFFFYCRF